MNKIITINLGGIAIQIEEDAYDMLRDYLKSLEIHFKGTENAEEILSDIESRIAEMLYERLRVGKVSINKDDINAVTTAMGNPSELEADEDEPKTTQSMPNNGKKIKRLFRDADDRKLGGVCAGLAKYFDIDVTIVRIIWLVMLFVFGTGFVVYALLWAILPEAKTAAEKLEMMGEVPNVENIKNTIRDEAAQAYTRLKNTAERNNIQNIFDKAVAFFVTIIKAFAKVIGVFIMISVLIAILAFFVKFFSGGQLLNWRNGLHINSSDFNTALVGSGTYWLVKVGVFLSIVIPLLYILVRILLTLLAAPRPTKIVKQSVLSIWILTLATTFGGILFGANQLKEEATRITKNELILTGDTLYIMASNFETDGVVELNTLIQLDVVQNSEGHSFVETHKTVRGRNTDDAEEGLNAVQDAFRISGNQLLLNEKILSSKNPKAKLPIVQQKVHLAEGKYVVFNANTRKIIHHIDNRQNIYDPQMAGKTFLMTNSGLSCVDCDKDEYPEIQTPSQTKEYIEHIDISDAVRVEIIEDGTNRIVYPKEKKWRESLDIELKSNKLYIRRNNNFGAILDWLSAGDDLKIEIHTSGLKSLELDGASVVKYIPDNKQNKEYFSVEMSGANNLTIQDLQTFKISVDLEGTNKLNASGNVNIFLIEADGANAIQAFDLISENINLDIAGAAVCGIHANKEISGKVEGASSLQYKGNPEVSVKSKGMSVVKAKD